MSLLDATKENVEYITQMISALEGYLNRAYQCAQNNEYSKAQTELDDAQRYYHTQIDSLASYKTDILSLNTSSDAEITQAEVLKALTECENIKLKLANVVKKIDAVSRVTTSAEAKQKKAVTATQARALAEQAEQAEQEETQEHEEAIKALDKLMTPEARKAEKTPLNMHILGGFVATLGITAVAIAFVALNAAGFAMPGVVLASVGMGIIYKGCCFFNDHDAVEYTVDHAITEASP